MITEWPRSANLPSSALSHLVRPAKGREFPQERIPNAPGCRGPRDHHHPDGHIITNNHALGDSTDIEVSLSDKTKTDRPGHRQRSRYRSGGPQSHHRPSPAQRPVRRFDDSSGRPMGIGRRESVRIGTNRDDTTLGDQLLQHLFGHVCGNGKTNPLCEVNDGGVDADHLAAQVEERSPRVARIDRRVGLNEVLIPGEIHIFPPDAAHHAECHGSFQSERIPDGQHPLAYPNCRRIAEAARWAGDGLSLL